MYKSLLILIITPLCFINSALAGSDEYATLTNELKSWGIDPQLVAAVKQQNQQKLSMDEIQQRDKTWQNTAGYDEFMKQLMNSNAAKALMALEEKAGFVEESFLMDNQGANVAMTNKTSDYWQGDEAKFKQSFLDGSGEGKIYLGEEEFDESTQSYVVQVSVPVIDSGKVIGVVTIATNMETWESRK